MFSIPSSPTNLSFCETISFNCSFVYLFLNSFLSVRANAILSNTFNESKRAEYWNTIAISPGDTTISPLSGFVKPQISFKIVLFPAPLNPTIARISPSSTLKETLSSISLFLNDFVKFLTSMLITVLSLFAFMFRKRI